LTAAAASGARPTLLTFAPMVDSETSRLLLLYYGVDYEEKDHLFGLVSAIAKFHGGTGNVPFLYGSGLALTGPAAISDHFDALLPPERRLAPPDGPLAAQVKADWATYNGGTGADTAVFAYHHLLPAKSLMAPLFAAPVPAAEKLVTPIFYPVLASLFRKLLQLSPERADQAQANIRATFDATDKRIADGRPYLCGDRLTLGDIALAAAAAPLLQPEGYGATMPPPDAMPPPIPAFVAELRAHPTGAFVKRLYAEGFAKARAAA
jgi:glutathione S-transferase